MWGIFSSHTCKMGYTPIFCYFLGQEFKAKKWKYTKMNGIGQEKRDKFERVPSKKTSYDFVKNYSNFTFWEFLQNVLVKEIKKWNFLLFLLTLYFFLKKKLENFRFLMKKTRKKRQNEVDHKHLVASHSAWPRIQAKKSPKRLFFKRKRPKRTDFIGQWSNLWDSVRVLFENFCKNNKIWRKFAKIQAKKTPYENTLTRHKRSQKAKSA